MHFYFQTPPPHAHAKPLHPDAEPTSDRCEICGRPVSYPTDRRTEMGHFGCTVYGYPSSGGVIIRVNADLVELTYLGLDRLCPASKKLDDQDAEDAFCCLLRKIGGKWWESIKRSRDVFFMDWNDCNPTKEELKQIFLAWPEEKKGVGVADS